jgi:hypothetical protein
MRYREKKIPERLVSDTPKQKRTRRGEQKKSKKKKEKKLGQSEV